MDKAREQTDKQLMKMERKIEKLYSQNLALRRIEKKYKSYMAMVEKNTEASYRAFVSESDRNIKQELKKAYMDEVKALTVKSKAYKRIIDEFTTLMTQVNQDALDIINQELTPVYVINYNQVAEVCKEVGVEVNG